jgi:acyl carrier protein
MNARFREVVSEVLGLSPAQITPDLRRTDTDLWDSINHLRLITILETEFGASFTMDEIAQAQTPADLERVIESRSCAVRET